MRVLVAAVLMGLMAGPLAALDADEMFADPEQEARAREIGRELRCLVCQNQSIFDSNAGLAKDLRGVVRERMLLGETDGEILAYVAERFGDYVLLKPRMRAGTWVLWAAPVGFLLIGGMGLAAYHRGRKRQVADDDLSEAERAEARRILGQEG